MFANSTEEIKSDLVDNIRISTVRVLCKYTAPWPYETMVFRRNQGDESIYHRAHKTLATAIRWHNKILALCKSGKLPVGQGIRKGIGLNGRIGNPSLTPQQWKDGAVQGEIYSCKDHRVVVTQNELLRAMKSCKISPNKMLALFDALREEGDIIVPTWNEIKKEESNNKE